MTQLSRCGDTVTTGKLQLAGERTNTVFDEACEEPLRWQTTDGEWKQAALPQVIFVR